MSISYPLNFPAIKAPLRVEFFAAEAVAVSRSPFTFQAQIQEHQGSSWSAQVTFPQMERADAEEWISFIAKLRGQVGTFFLGDPLGKTPRGIATGTPLVKGASQTGFTLATDGWTVSITGILKAGDYIQLGQRLYKVMSDADSDGSGNATFDIWPRLRESPADNSTVITSSPQGIFRLAQNINQLWSAGIEHLYDVSISCVEAL